MGKVDITLKIYRSIKSCQTTEQISTCIHWALDLARRDYISKSQYEILSAAIYNKWREVSGVIVQHNLE